MPSATRSARCDVNPLLRGAGEAYLADMWTVLVILLVAWAVLSVVGFALEGLLWLGIIGVILFVGTLIFGLVRNRSRNR